MEILPCLSQDVNEPLCIHISDICRMEYETIGWRNGKCLGKITPSLPVRPVSDPGSYLVSGSPYVVAADSGSPRHAS